MTATNKRLLITESRGDSNWCTLCREKPDQHATCFLCSVRIWPKTICISCGLYIATFHTVVNNDGQSYCSREKVLPTQPDDWLIRGSIPSFFSKPASEAVGLKPPSVDDRLLGLLAHKHQYAIGTFNTCSRGSTYRSLTDPGGGYNLGGAGLSHITPRPFQQAVSTFHLRAPPSLQFNPVPLSTPKYWVLK
jgi:hypothetical protein